MENSYVKLYSGTEIEVLAAQAILKEHDIPFIVKNEHTSGVLAGFYGGEVVRLYVLKPYEEEASTLLASL